MSVSGIFQVSFNAALPGAGGFVAVENGTVRGGDNQFSYSGTFEENGEKSAAVLRIEALSPSAKSVFGTHGSFELQLTGTISDSSFSFTGPSPVGGPSIGIQGRKVAPLK